MDEHESNVRMVRWVCIAVAFTLSVLFCAVAYGCHQCQQRNIALAELDKALIEQGFTEVNRSYRGWVKPAE